MNSVELGASPRDIPVCVVIPNFNYGYYLEQAIESVVEQTHPIVDVLVYDDGSQDESFKIAWNLMRLHRSRFRNFEIISDSGNKGKLSVLNRSISLVDAPVLSILDADDWLSSDFLERTVERLFLEHRENPAVSFVYTDCILVDREGIPICRGSSRSFDARALLTSSYVPDCAPVLTERLKAVLPFDATIRVATKHHKWLRLVSQGNVGVHMAEPLFSYRMHENNMSGIGIRVRTDMETGARREAILARYWGTAAET